MSIYSNTLLNYWDGTHSGKCVWLYKPRWGSLQYTEAIWCSLLLLGYKPVQHVAEQSNARLNPAQDKMM